MNRINKKAGMNWELAIIVTAVIFLVAASFAIIPKLSDLGGWVQKLGFNFGTQETTTQTIDEERIDADTPIPINIVVEDTDSGGSFIVKQAYGQGWNLESVFSQTPIRNKAGEIMKVQTSYQTIISNKKLSEILGNKDPKDPLQGSISVNGKTYVHIPSQNNGCWFVSHNEQNKYGGEQYNDNNHNCQLDEGEPYTDANKNGKYDAEEPIPDDKINDLAQLIVADLFNKAGGAKS